MRPSTILTGLAASLGILYLVSKGTGKVNGCIPDWQCEQPLNGYESDGCGNRRLNIACNPLPLGCSPLSCNLAVGGAGSSVEPGSDVKFDMFVVGGSGTPPYNYKLYINNELIINMVSEYPQISHTHTFAESGSYSIKLEVTDSCSVPQICTKTSGVTVLSLGCAFNINDNVPQGTQIVAMIWLQGGGLPPFTFELYKNNVLVNSKVSSDFRELLGHIPMEPPGTILEFKGKMIDSRGRSCTKSAEVTVTDPTPVTCLLIPNIPNNAPVRQGQTWSLMGAVDGGLPPYMWSIYKGTVILGAGIHQGGGSNLPTVYYQFNDIGTHTFTFEAVDSRGIPCKSSVEVIVV